jgi:hypothetical protein
MPLSISTPTDLVCSLQDAHTHLQAQQQLVALKQATSRVLVHSIPAGRVQKLNLGKHVDARYT